MCQAQERKAEAEALDASTFVPAGLPEKYRRAAELAHKDVSGKRWEYYVNPFPKWAERHLCACLNDARDWPMVVLTSNVLCSTVLAVAALWALPPLSAYANWLGLAYVVLNTALFDARFILCLHYSSHLKLWSPTALGQVGAGLLNEVLPTLLAPLFGIPPGMYFLHHVVMHHVEDNNFPGDLSSTQPYKRDSFLEFVKYWITYITLTAFYLPYYALSKGRVRLATYSGVLLLSYLCGVKFAWGLHSSAALWTLVVPFLKSSLTLMFGNWSQHIFVDPARPSDDYLSTYNCLDVFDNRFTFNDGYHIIHHVNARKHWAEMPAAFVASLPAHEAKGALIFEGLFFFDVGILGALSYLS